MNLIADLRYALRSFARVNGLSATIVVTLALGLGATAAIFSVVRGVLLRPLVNRDEDRLILRISIGHRSIAVDLPIHYYEPGGRRFDPAGRANALRALATLCTPSSRRNSLRSLRAWTSPAGRARTRSVPFRTHG